MCLTCRGAVEQELRIKAVIAVVVGGEGDVVPRGEALKLHPRLPAGGEAILARAGFLDLLGEFGHFRPRRGEMLRVAAGLFHGVLVVVEDGGGGVEGHGDELAVRGGVVAGYGAEELGGVHRGAGGFHDFIHGADGALGGHHAGGAHFKNLDQVGVLFGAEGGDGGGHGFVIVALIDALDFVFVLRRVEFLDHLVGDFTEFATHAVPEGNGGLGLGRRGQQHQTHGQQGHQTEGTHRLSYIGGRKPSGCIPPGPVPGTSAGTGPASRAPLYGEFEKGGKTFSRKSLLPHSVRHSPSALRQAAGKSVMMPVAPSAARRLASPMSLTVHTLTANPASRSAARSPGARIC